MWGGFKFACLPACARASLTVNFGLGDVKELAEALAIRDGQLVRGQAGHLMHCGIGQLVCWVLDPQGRGQAERDRR